MPAKKTPKKTAGYLIFVDTNILLDFYRVRNDAALSLLRHIDNNLDKFITTPQVEVEFKTNRINAILESYASLKVPDALSLPAFLAESKQSAAIRKNRKQVGSLLSKLKQRVPRVLRNPTTQDRVYKTVQRLLRTETAWNLFHFPEEEQEVYVNLARKRFERGYPPRKPASTSMGDSVNWEWTIRCANESGRSIVVVSRDGDYGKVLDGEPVMNDWLVQEFRERVSKKRKLILTDRLSEGLKVAGIVITDKVEASERKFVARQRSVTIADERLREVKAFVERFRKYKQEPLPKAISSQIQALMDEDGPEPGIAWGDIPEQGD